jgi:putative spermidine/putrescine transport system ATP-binding protein
VAEFIGVTNSFSGSVSGDAVLLAGGRRLPAAAVAGRPDGSAVRVLVRPADLRVSPDGQLPGTVLTHSFLGPVTRLVVRLADEQVVRADVPSADAARTPVGAQVLLAVDASAPFLGAER